MKKRKVEAVDVPPSALARYDFSPVHYSDAFRIGVAAESSTDMLALARYLFERNASFPIYARWLFFLRSIIVKPFDIKSASEMATAAAAGNDASVSIFQLYRQTIDEIILGEDDNHLDARISMLKTREDGQCYVTVTTFVRIHNRIGRVYFALIKPFHKILIAAVMRRALG